MPGDLSVAIFTHEHQRFSGADCYICTLSQPTNLAQNLLLTFAFAYATLQEYFLNFSGLQSMSENGFSIYPQSYGKLLVSLAQFLSEITSQQFSQLPVSMNNLVPKRWENKAKAYSQDLCESISV